MVKEYKYQTILKLNEIFKMGYLPSRGDESYSDKHASGIPFGTIANCFAHACFNLKNEQLQLLDAEDSRAFVGSIDYLEQPVSQIARNLLDFVEAAGLKIRRVSKFCLPNKNQWLVALYFGKSCLDGQNQDYHFMLKEADGVWSHKMGHKNVTEYCDKPPQSFTYSNYYKYTLYGYYLITNPYAKSREGSPKDDNNQAEESVEI